MPSGARVPTVIVSLAAAAALVVGAIADRPKDGPGSVPEVTLSNNCNLAYVEVAVPRDFDKCTPTGDGGGLDVVDGHLSVPMQLRGSVVNCDCGNTEAPDIGGAATRQCLKAERDLMSLAGQDALVFEVEDDKLKSGPSCDSVTAGPGAWPVLGASTTPPNPGPDPPPCTDPPDPNSRCLPTG